MYRVVAACGGRAQARIGMPVNPVLASVRRWEADADALIRQIKESPVIDLTAEIRSPDPGTETAS